MLLKKINTQFLTVLFTFALITVSSSICMGQNCIPSPRGTAGYWVSSSQTDEILRFDEDGNFLSAFTTPTLNGPRGISALPNGDVYLSSQFSSEIIVVNTEGDLQRAFSSVELSGPTGSALSANGDFFVCSFNNDQVLRFDSNENLIGNYTSAGLNGPNCIVFKEDGEFWVTGQLSNDVHRFSPTGVALGSFPATTVSSAMGAAFDLDGNLLVAGGGSHTIGIFDCDGNHLDTWDVTGGPQSIDIREDGAVVVTTFFTDEVRVYFAGNLVNSWTGGDTLRGMEFFEAPLPEFIRGDSNKDDLVNIADVLATLGYLFSGLALPCPAAADVDDDSLVVISDPVYLLAHLFSGGPAPASPFPNAAIDPTADSLGCLDQ